MQQSRRYVTEFILVSNCVFEVIKIKISDEPQTSAQNGMCAYIHTHTPKHLIYSHTHTQRHMITHRQSLRSHEKFH